MNEYIVKVGFWIRAYDSTTIHAASDIDAVEQARESAIAMMNASRRPKEIDNDSRCAGVMVFVDRVAPSGRTALVEDFAFHHANDAPPGFDPQQS